MYKLIFAALLFAGTAQAQSLPTPSLGKTSVLGSGASNPVALNDTGLTVQLNTPAKTADTIYKCIIYANCTGTSMVADGLRSIAVNTSGTTAPTLINAISGYMYNNTPLASGTNFAAGMALSAFAIGAVDNSATWGLNVLMSDNPNGLQTSTGVGRFITNEIDLNITSLGSSGNGLAVGGTFLVANTGFNGFSVNTLWGSSGTGPSSPFGKWANGFITGDGAASIGVAIGLATYTSTANDNSQPLYFAYRNSASARNTLSLTASGGSLFLDGTETAPSANLLLVRGGIFLPTNRGISINNNAIVAADSGANAYFATASSFTSINIGNTTAGSAVTILGQVNLNSGTPLSTSATTGFVGLPTTSGTPTGAPTPAAVSCAINTTGSFLNCYWGGSWKRIAFTAGAG